MAWTFDNNTPTTQAGITAPTYKDVFTDFLGGSYMTGYDPALAQTLNAGRSGSLTSGLGAFLNKQGTDFQAANTVAQGGSGYADADMMNLAKSAGIDTQGKTGIELENLLAPQFKDYMTIGGMSAGWNPTGDARQANTTLYKRQDGQLVPIQTQGYSAPETSHGFIGDHPGILYPLAVVGGGLAASYLGAGASGTGAGAGGATGAAPAYGGVGTAGAGAAGEGLSTLGQLQAYWANLPAWGQGAATGAAQGGISSGLQGKNILQGALMGGLTGGVGAVGGQYLSSLTGMPLWAGRGLTSAGLGGLTGGVRGAIGGGLGSLAASGLSEAGLPGGLAGKLGGMAGNAVAGGIAGDAGGGSGGVGMAGGGSSGSTQSGGAPRDLSGLLGNPQLGAASAQEKAWLNQSYAPVAAEAQKKKLASQLQEDWA